MSMSMKPLIRKILFAILMSLFASMLHAAEGDWLERPHLSLAIKGGYFYPEEDDWDRFYDDSYTPAFAAEAAWMLTRYFEIGAGAGYIHDSGEGFLPENNTTGGDVDIYLYPVNAYVKLRGVFREDQLLVPYIGGGWTQVFYKQEIENQGNKSGNSSGYHVKAGVELLLNGIDRNSAATARNEFGLKYTYLFVEGEYTSVEDDKTNSDLGGKAWYLGLRLDF